MPRYHHTRDEARIRAAIGRMPGGAAEPISAVARTVGIDAGSPQPIGLADVADYLEAVVDLHARFYADAAAKEKELAALKADVAAMRRVLGTA